MRSYIQFRIMHVWLRDHTRLSLPLLNVAHVYYPGFSIHCAAHTTTTTTTTCVYYEHALQHIYTNTFNWSIAMLSNTRPHPRKDPLNTSPNGRTSWALNMLADDDGTYTLCTLTDTHTQKHRASGWAMVEGRVVSVRYHYQLTLGS